MTEGPKTGEYWEIVSGSGRGLVLRIIDTPEITPAENPYVRVVVEDHAHDERSVPLDDRWGRSIVRFTGLTQNSRQKIRQRTAADRLTRIGIANYRVEEPREVLHKLLGDYVTAHGLDGLVNAFNEFQSPND